VRVFNIIGANKKIPDPS